MYCYLSFLNCTLLDCDRKINGEKNSDLNIKHFLLFCILQQQWQIRSFLEYLRSWFCVFILCIRKGSEKLDAERYMENILVTKCKPFIAKAWKLCHECVSVMLNALPQTGLLCHVYDISHHTIYYIPLNFKKLRITREVSKRYFKMNKYTSKKNYEPLQNCIEAIF